MLREATAQDDTHRKVKQDLERGQCRKGLTGKSRCLQRCARWMAYYGILMRG